MSWLDIKWAVQDAAERTGNFLTGGRNDRKKSENIRRWAKEQEEEARARLDTARQEANKELTHLAEVRVEVYRTTVTDFVQLYELLGALENSGRLDLDDKLKLNQTLQDVVMLKQDSEHISQILMGSGVGALGGATLAVGAYGLAGIVGTASTGTAIGTLSGAAATNATLAWFGGGALSAGGVGVAGGTAVLGGIAVVPAALVAMYFGQNQAKQKLNAARDFSDQMDVLEAQINTLIAQIEQICKGARLMTDTITALNAVVRVQNSIMRTALIEAAEKALELQTALEVPLLADNGNGSEEFSEFMAVRFGHLNPAEGQNA